MSKISVVIPLYNEEESLTELCSLIAKVMKENNFLEWEAILIDDGSTDTSFKVIETICKENDRVKGIKFARNYGKAAALYTGFQEADGDYIITMDADLQDNPDEIPELVQMLKDGYHLISGWKKKRYDPISKTIPTKLFNLTTSIVAGLRLHDFNCGLKAYTKACAKSLNFYGEMHRFLPVLAHWNNFKVTEKVVKHQARKYGETKYGLSRFINGFLDLLTITFLRKYSKNPMHLFGSLGVLFMLIGFSISGYFGIEWIIKGSLHLRPLMLLGVGSLLMGLQLFSIGFIGEMITHTRNNVDYMISSKLNI